MTLFFFYIREANNGSLAVRIALFEDGIVYKTISAGSIFCEFGKGGSCEYLAGAKFHESGWCAIYLLP